MALTINDLKAHCNVTGNDDNAVLTRLLAAAQAHVERLLGFKLNNTDELPDGPPADLELAVLQLAAEFYENREASISGTIITGVPFSVREIVAEYRNYTFGGCVDGE